MRPARLAALFALMALAALPVPAVAKPDSGVRGTVLDTTAESGCPPPPCRAAAAPCPLAAGASIVCPQLRTPPRYEGEAASVLVRRAGSAEVLGRVPVAGGRFTAHLTPGRYVLRAHVALPCWSGNRQVVEIEAGRWIPLVLRVANGCIAHPDT